MRHAHFFAAGNILLDSKLILHHIDGIPKTGLRFVGGSHHICAGRTGCAVQSKHLHERLNKRRIVGQFHRNIFLSGHIVFQHFPHFSGIPDSLGHRNAVVHRDGIGHITAGRHNQVAGIIYAVQQIKNTFHIVLLIAVEHHRSQRDISADSDIVLVRDRLSGGKAHIFVNGNGIRTRLAHHLDIAGSVTADKEG